MSQVAVNIRLFMAVAISISIFMLVEDTLQIGGDLQPTNLANLILGEVFIGLALAIPVRLLFLALTFLGEILTQFIGLNPIPGTPIGDTQASPTLSSMFNMTAVVLLFSSGIVFTFIVALADSFREIPPGTILEIGNLTQSLGESLTGFFKTVLRLGAPIIIYTIIMNVIAGFVNKLSPQIPVYFVSAPFLIFGGLAILGIIGDDILTLFTMEVDRLLQSMF